MNNFILFFILLVCSFQGVLGQVYSDNLVISTQEQIDNFSFKEIRGTLTIKEVSPGEITNLLGLSSLERIIIKNNNEEALRIVDNQSLINLDGLNNLSFIGLNNIESINDYGGIFIKRNTSLETLNGLNGIIKLSNFWIEKNPSLSDLRGLSSAKHFRSVNILDNSSLKNITGLNLQLPISWLLITNNDSLENIDALNSLTTIDNGPFIFITGNDNLKNLDGLKNIQVPYMGSAFISFGGNTALENACGFSKLLKATKEQGGEYSICCNSSTTSSIEDIINECEGCSVYEGNYTIDSQEDIDNFNYCEITGNLTIEEAVTGDITNLSGLSKLETIGGSLYIKSNSGIINLNGLNNLTAINGSLQLHRNKNLTDLTGLSTVKTVKGNIVITMNHKITSLSAFNSLTTLGGNLNIQFNEGLLNFDGFINLQKIGGFVEIKGNRSIIGITGLSSLENIVKDLNIIGNAKLTTISGLNKLKNVGATAKVINNTLLNNLDGFLNLTSVIKNLDIQGNSALENACGIKQLLTDTTAVGGIITIHTNSTNTSSPQAIIDFCNSRVSGRSIDTVSSIIDKKLGNEIRVYPNPVKNELHIQCGDTILSVSISNYTGQTIYQKVNAKVKKLTIFSIKYPSGIYLVKINTQKGSIVKKVVVE